MEILVPLEYQMAVRLQQENRFNENDVKSFVHHLFALFDKHVDVNQFLLLIVDEDLEMQFPEITLHSHADFKKWYVGIGEKYVSNTHQVERLSVKFPGAGKYEVDLVVYWQAVTRENKYISFRVHQVWTLDDGNGGQWPRILRYIVEELK